MYNLPNILTLMRLALVPVLVACFFLPYWWWPWLALAIYTLATVTDYFDGYLARSMNQISAFGRFLDPIADKILVIVLLIMLVFADRLPDLWVLPALIIIVREILVAGLREFLGPANIQLPVSKLAKWKTAVQMFALGFVIVGDIGDVVLPHTLLIGQIGLIIAALLTVVTGWAYIKVGLKHIQDM